MSFAEGSKKFGLAILLLVAATEGLLRIFLGNNQLAHLVQMDPGDGRCVGLRPGIHEPYTGSIRRLPSVIHDVNQLGYRGAERPQAKTPGVRRLAAIGDSFTYGLGIETNQTLPFHIEQILNQHSSSARVEMLNFGIPGLNADDYLEQYEKFAKRWHPDQVVLFLYRNDLDAPLCHIIRQVPWWFWYVHEVYVLRIAFLPYFLARVQTTTDHVVPPRDHLRELVHTMLEATTRHGASLRLVVLDDPLLPIGATQPTSELASLLNETGVVWFEMRERFRAQGESALPRLPGDEHLTDEGNRLIAEPIANWLRSQGLQGSGRDRVSLSNHRGEQRAQALGH